MKLLGSTERRITKGNVGENVPQPEISEVVLVHYNIVNNYCQRDSRVLCTFVTNNSFGQLLNISTTSYIYLKIFHTLKNGLLTKTLCS